MQNNLENIIGRRNKIKNEIKLKQIVCPLRGTTTREISFFITSVNNLNIAISNCINYLLNESKMLSQSAYQSISRPG